MAAVLVSAFGACDEAMAGTTSPACSPSDAYAGTCSVTSKTTGTGVDLNGNATRPGSNSHGASKPGTKKAHKKLPTKPAAPADPLKVVRDEFGVIDPLTISDLASFKPLPGTDHMEPNGWTIVGLDTNFYATVGNETENGTLLGQPASVRFIPVRWHWSYGDGSGVTRTTTGSTWAAQGLDQFDQTPTSHIYGKAGSYDIDLSIEFGAEYEFANSGWVPVTGTITVPANRLQTVAGRAKTVLVNRDCIQNPDGPGC
jgi:hypothetical protein